MASRGGFECFVFFTITFSEVVFNRYDLNGAISWRACRFRSKEGGCQSQDWLRCHEFSGAKVCALFNTIW